MKYPYKVNHNGVYYEAGQEVPEDQEGEREPLPFSDSDITFETAEDPKLSREELELMTVKDIKKKAEKLGFTITKVIKNDVIEEFLDKQ